MPGPLPAFRKVLRHRSVPIGRLFVFFFNAVCLPTAESGTAANTDRSAVETKNCSASLQTVVFCLFRLCCFYPVVLQDLVAIVAPLEEGEAICPPPLGSASAPACTSDSPGLPPSLPPSLADTQPFVVDLENLAASPNAQSTLAAVSQLASFASLPPSPSNSVVRPLLPNPSSPTVRSVAARSPGPSPGASSASWSMVPPLPSP